MLQQASCTVSEAIRHDELKSYTRALELYKTAIREFLFVIKYEPNPATNKRLCTKVGKYLDRAEALGHLPAENIGEIGEIGCDQDLREALAGAVVDECPNVSWDDIAGLEGAKAVIKEAVILPLRFPQLFTGKRRPWKAILLYGPAGTGKSYLAQAVATESQSTFFSISSSDLVSKYQGESERLVKSLFDMARERRPSVVFIDEIDSLCGVRGEGDTDSSRRIKTELLVQMQGVGNDTEGILVLGATNTPWTLDPAIRRRFEKRVYIALPDAAARKTLFVTHLGPEDAACLTSKHLAKAVSATEGFSGSDIKVVAMDALMAPIRVCQRARQFIERPGGMMEPCREYPHCPHCPPNEKCASCGALPMHMESLKDDPAKLKVPPMQPSDLVDAVARGSRTVSPADLRQYTTWTKEFGQDG
jgi:vacuolar protein-sorting-associated protein 4